MRPVATLALTLVVAVLTACQGMMPASSGAQAGSRLSAILESGRLRVGTSGDLPPLNMRDSRDQIRGFEPDLIETLAGAMNLEVEYVVRPFAELLPALEGGEVDLVIAGMTITPSRNARVAFAGPYFISGTSMVARTGTLEDVQGAEQLDDPRRTFAALEGSTSARFVEEVLPRARRVTTPDYETAVKQLLAGEVDAVVADHLACKLAVWRNPDANLATLMTPFTTEPLGIALPADDPLLLNLVQNFLNTIEDTGELTLLKARWLADGAWLEELR
jgi:polar amino acid transport system substrate-binding protein